MTVESHTAARSPVEWGFRALFICLVVFQLFIPPALGVADDNDFQKLTGRWCLGHDPQPVLFDYTDLDWRFSSHACVEWPFRSSAELPLLLAIGLNRLFLSPVTFDLRWMGLVNSALFFAGFLWLQRCLRAAPVLTSAAAQAAFLLVTCNAVYVPNFNSFYFDTMTMIALVPALVGTALLLLQAEVSAKTLLVVAACVTALASSKAQHSLLGLVFLPAFWRRRGRKVFPQLGIRLAATAAVVAGAGIAVRTIPDVYPGQAAFSVLFYRILPGVSDPSRYLSETRIPPAYLSFVGKNAFSPGIPLSDPAEARRFAGWFGPSDLAVFFVRHPSLAWRMLIINLDEGSLDRVRMKTGNLPHRLGNYEKATGKPPQTLSHFFCFWPAIKYSVIADHPRIYLLYIFVMVAAAWIFAPDVDGMRSLLAIVTAMLTGSVAAVMSDGVDSGRHLIIFNFLLDLVVVAVATFAVDRFVRSRDTRSPLARESGVEIANPKDCST